MTLTLYGKGGRTFRSLWMLEEAQQPYQHQLVDWSKGESHTAKFLTINPNGKVPVLDDNGLILFESLAINYHLARTYASTLWVQSVQQESLATQWLAWGMGELEGPHDAANRLQQAVDQDRSRRALTVLQQTLDSQPYLLGDRFTVVDLNTSCLLLRPQYRPLVQQHSDLSEWFKRCIKRAALARAMQLVDG